MCLIWGYRGKIKQWLISLKNTAFQKKLVLFSSDLPDRMLHFPTLRDFIKSSANATVTQVMSDFLNKLRDNFATRFNDFDMPTELLYFTRAPFSNTSAYSPKAQEFLTSLDIDEGSLHLEIIDMQASTDLKHALERGIHNVLD